MTCGQPVKKVNKRGLQLCRFRGEEVIVSNHTASVERRSVGFRCPPRGMHCQPSKRNEYGPVGFCSRFATHKSDRRQSAQHVQGCRRRTCVDFGGPRPAHDSLEGGFGGPAHPITSGGEGRPFWLCTSRHGIGWSCSSRLSDFETLQQSHVLVWD